MMCDATILFSPLSSPLLGCLVLHVGAVAAGREGVRLPLLPLAGGAVVADVGQQVVLGRQHFRHRLDEGVSYFLLQVTFLFFAIRILRHENDIIS